ncbi:protein kintoun isoform X1 [Lingula anatina]|uniref:Protein kintoun n=1 Tax=Lingula anatina TaxID=7574 RepID=A0A1S3HCV8_LINAN|nr:protein kintoun isoform X1 [Lingula anatina]|eukprot:XP_013383361.1 protein kintoun isoform X1 [Lingula anatina]
MASKRGGLEGLDLSSDEIKRLTNALKNEEFQKLFAEYAEEISDPENRKRYEEEIAQLESERGMDITFVNPDPGYVIKTTVNGEQKAFINICKNEHIDKPQMTKELGPNGKTRVGWQIPHSFSPPRDDLDKGGQKCKVYDVVFNPDAYRMAESNARFKKMIQDTAFDGIERQFDVKLDRKNLKFPKMKFKGVPVATVIRKRKDEGPNEQDKPATNVEGDADDDDDPLSKLPYPYDNKTTEEKRIAREEELAKQNAKKAETEAKTKVTATSTKDPDAAEIPVYHIIHRSDMDLGDYRNAPDAKTSTRPKELAVVVTLPLLKSAANIDLEIFEKRLLLESETPAKYKLDLKLPYPVDETKGSAKFDKSKRQLIITLPVLPAETPKLPSFIDDKEENPPLQNGTLSNSAVDGKPLVEVISSLENENPSATATAPVSSTNHSVKLQIPYSLPEYDIFQDETNVSVILNVRRVDKASCNATFTQAGCLLQMTSLGSGGFPNHYSICLSFPDKHCLAKDMCTVDIGETNVVVLLKKNEDCQSQWESYSVGLNEDHLEERLFVTENTLEKELTGMKEQNGQATAQQVMPEVEVTEMNDQKVTLLVKGNNGPVNPGAFSRQTPDVELEDPSGNTAENIEVVFDKEVPKLHSILKQRSTSESGSEKQRHASGDSSGGRARSTSESSVGKQRTISESSTDDLSASLSASHNSYNSESLQSNSNSDSGEEGDHPRLKKSVSFSEDVDSVHYKSGAAISAFHNTLKNKKRRARKREQKQENRRSRRRHNSSTSEYSSSSDKEEGELQGHSEKDKQAESNLKKQTTFEEVFDHRGQDEGQVEGHVDAAITEMMQEQQNSSNRDATIPNAIENDELMTKQQTITGNGKLETSNECDEKSSKSASDKMDKLRVKHSQGDDSDDNEDTQETSEEVVKPKDPDDKVETVLSWEEPRKGPNIENTKCAFDFANSLMYDLDD